MTEDSAGARRSSSGREAVEELVASGALDELFERIDAGEIELTGSDGLVPGLIKAALERGLQAELTDHLGYESRTPRRSGPASSSLYRCQARRLQPCLTFRRPLRTVSPDLGYTSGYRRRDAPVSCTRFEWAPSRQRTCVAAAR